MGFGLELNARRKLPLRLVPLPPKARPSTASTSSKRIEEASFTSSPLIFLIHYLQFDAVFLTLNHLPTPRPHPGGYLTNYSLLPLHAVYNRPRQALSVLDLVVPRLRTATHRVVLRGAILPLGTNEPRRTTFALHVPHKMWAASFRSASREGPLLFGMRGDLCSVLHETGTVR